MSESTFCYYVNKSYPKKVEQLPKISIKQMLKAFVLYDSIEKLLINPRTTVKQNGVEKVNGFYCKVYNIKQKYMVYYNDQFDLIVKCTLTSEYDNLYQFTDWEIKEFKYTKENDYLISFEFRSMSKTYEKENKKGNDFFRGIE